MPRIGEGWISEAELYHRVRDAFPQYKVVHHARPRWLGRQHLDIHIPEIRTAIEYQGAQHRSPIDFFGGEKAFKETVERDKKKRAKCSKNGCTLICVHEECDFGQVLRRIQEAADRAHERAQRDTVTI